MDRQYEASDRANHPRDEEGGAKQENSLSPSVLLQGIALTILLVQACASGNVATVIDLITERHADPLARDEFENTPLGVACAAGHIAVVKYLIETQGVNPATCRGGSLGFTPLHSACNGGHIEVVKYLICEQGMDSSCLDDVGATPLHYARTREIAAFLVEEMKCDTVNRNKHRNTPLHDDGRLDVIKYLVTDHHCDPAIEGNDGATPLYYACRFGHIETVKWLIVEQNVACTYQYLGFACQSGSVDLVRYFIQKKGMHPSSTSLFVAALHGRLDVVKYLINGQYCDPNCSRVYYGHTPLHVACISDQIDVVKYLINEAGIDPSCEDDNGSTPLFYTNDVNIADVLFTNKNCDANHRNKRNDTCLHVAARHGRLDVVRYFIAIQHCDPNCSGEYGQTPLHVASSGGQLDVVKYLITSSSCDPNCKGEYDRTPLHSACLGGHIAVVKYLVNEQGVDPSCEDDIGCTPLFYASNVCVADFLIIDKKCNVNHRNKRNNTPLHHAALYGQLHVVKYLINSWHCDPTCKGDCGDTPLHVACSRGHIAVVKYLIDEQQMNPACENNFGATPLYYAINIEVMKFLIDRGCSVDRKDRFNGTALHNAAFEGRLEVVQYLIADQHCDPACRGEYGRTPLHYASAAGHVEVVKYLIQEQGVNPHCKDDNGVTPLDCAHKTGIIYSADEKLALHITMNPRMTYMQAALDLPPGWEPLVSTDGKIVYINHDSQTVTSQKPILNLAPGWEQRWTHKGKLYYVDHNTRSTSWFYPRMDSSQLVTPPHTTIPSDLNPPRDSEYSGHRLPSTTPQDTKQTVPIIEATTEIDEETRRIYEEAMTKGYIESALTILILVGVMGSGKTLFKRLVLGLSVPDFSPSTPLAKSSVRSLSICQVAVGGEGPVKWQIVTPSDMVDIVADSIKQGVDLSWENISQLAFTSDSEFTTERPENTERSVLHNERKTPYLIVSEELLESEEVVANPHQHKKEPQDKSAAAPFSTKFSEALKGINLNQELMQKLSKPSGRIKLMDIDFVYILDSGGQPPFREMLSHFVQESSAFVLMQKLNERLDFKPPVKYREEGGEDDVQYPSQLTNEQTLHQYFQAVQSHNSRVFVVGTHRDREQECDTESKEEKNERLLEAFRPILGSLFRAGDPDQLMFPVDCTSREPEDLATAQAFREAVMKLCLGKKVKIPLPWFMFEQLLRQLAERMKEKVLHIEECCEVAQMLLMPHNVCKAAIEFLGKLNILFYRPSVLPHVVFCDAQVILDKITELVRCSHELKSNTQQSLPQKWQSGEWLDFRDFAQIDSKILGEFASHYREGLFTVPEFLELLEDLLIAGKLENGKHFMPSVLPDLSLEEVAQYRVTSSKHPSPMALYYTINSSAVWLPVGVVPSLVVHLQNHYKWKPVLQRGKPACMYHNCMQFELPGGKAGSVTLIDSTKFLEIHVKASLKVASKVCPCIRSMILSGLKEAHKSLHYDSAVVEDGVLCSGECGNKEPHLATLDEDKESWKCSEDTATGDDLDKERQGLWFVQPETIPKGLIKLNLRHLQVLCCSGGREIRIMNAVAGRWEALAIALGFDTDKLGIIKRNSLACSETACLDLFHRWLAEETRVPATWEVLLKALRDGNFKELAQELEAALGQGH